MSDSTTPTSGQKLALYWDFFGPRAEGTARHFQTHLSEFLEREGIEGCSIGVESSNPRHWAAWCRAPLELEEALAGALKPRRRTLLEATSAG